MIAVTRRIYRRGLNPVLGALFPDITNDYEVIKMFLSTISS